MMEENFLYQQIAESIRREILDGILKPGTRLPPIRQMKVQWNCTLGTIQRAYQELSKQGLVTSRAGQGTKITSVLPILIDTPLRHASLVHRAEEFLLENLTSGYSQNEIEQSLRMAMDRWRVFNRPTIIKPVKTIRFSGSHDMAMLWLASNFDEQHQEYQFLINFTGSLGGLIALAQGQADLAGTHIWDEQTDRYNTPLVLRLFPGIPMAQIHVTYRNIGLMMHPNNPLGITGLKDIVRPNILFVNRQSGSGTRQWLDIHLKKNGVNPADIKGYELERLTHSEVARTIAENQADVGLGLEAAAYAYGLDFLFLTQECYEWVTYANNLNTEPLHLLINLLKSTNTRSAINRLGGYDTSQSGHITLTN